MPVLCRHVKEEQCSKHLAVRYVAMQGQEGVDFTLGNVDDLDPSEWQVPPHCIPIHANVMTYDWSTLISTTQFDVIMMDPPWQLATANPTRGVFLFFLFFKSNELLVSQAQPASSGTGYHASLQCTGWHAKYEC